MQIGLSRKVKQAKAGRPKIANILAKVKANKPLSFCEKLELNHHKLQKQRAKADAEYQAIIDQLHAEIPPLEKELKAMIKDQDSMECDAIKARDQQLKIELSKINLNLPTIQDVTDKSISMEEYHRQRTSARGRRLQIIDESNQRFEELRVQLREKAEMILRKQHKLDQKKSNVRYFMARMSQNYIDLLESEKEIALQDQGNVLGDDRAKQQHQIREQKELLQQIEADEIMTGMRFDNQSLEDIERFIFKPWLPAKYIPDLLEQIRQLTHDYESDQRYSVLVNKIMPHQNAGIEVLPDGQRPVQSVTRPLGEEMQKISVETARQPARTNGMGQKDHSINQNEGPTVKEIPLPGKGK